MIEVTDRYQVFGLPYPDTETMCLGECEGMGFVPIHESETNKKWLALWREAHRKCGFWKSVRSLFSEFTWPHWKYTLRHWSCDGWHFVKCPDCNGSRKRPVDVP